MSKPKRVKKPAQTQFNVRVAKDIFAKANAWRVLDKKTWPELIEELLLDYVKAAELDKNDASGGVL